MLEIQENISLSNYTTFRTGGSARYFTVINNKDELKEVVDFAQQNQLPLYVLGGGSNLLISDDSVDGLVIKIEIKGIEINDNNVVAGAGEVWDELVEEVVKKDLSGIENLSYIPGTVGASVVQNIGAYGVELKDVIDWVEVFDTKEKELKTLNKKDLELGYRDSIFKRNKNLIVLKVAINLQKDGKLNLSYKDLQNFSQEGTLKELREVVIEVRKNKLPDWNKIGTAGSFFKNPVINKSQLEKIKKDFPEIPVYPAENEKFKISLAYLLDKLGWKDKREGGAGVYIKQPLALVNYGEGTSTEIKNLAEKITKDVKEKTGVDIEPEVVIW